MNRRSLNWYKGMDYQGIRSINQLSDNDTYIAIKWEPPLHLALNQSRWDSTLASRNIVEPFWFRKSESLRIPNNMIKREATRNTSSTPAESGSGSILGFVERPWHGLHVWSCQWLGGPGCHGPITARSRCQWAQPALNPRPLTPTSKQRQPSSHWPWQLPPAWFLNTQSERPEP